jgi:hypothetical protein
VSARDDRSVTRSPRLPVGTQVVLRRRLPATDGGTVQRGATGRVASYLDDGRYDVQLAGQEVACTREDVSLRGVLQHDLALGTPTLAGLDDAAARSALPQQSSAHSALHDLLVRVRFSKRTG